MTEQQDMSTAKTNAKVVEHTVASYDSSYDAPDYPETETQASAPKLPDFSLKPKNRRSRLRVVSNYIIM